MNNWYITIIFSVLYIGYFIKSLIDIKNVDDCVCDEYYICKKHYKIFKNEFIGFSILFIIYILLNK
jgi:hypothetical protein